MSISSLHIRAHQLRPGRMLARRRWSALPRKLIILAMSLSAVVGSTTAVAQIDPVLFEMRGQAYRIGDLPPKLRSVLWEQETRHYQERRELFDQLIFDAVLESESTRTGRSRRELAAEMLDYAQPTDAEARKFYEANRHRITEDFEAIKERIVSSMRADRLRARKAELVANLERSPLLTVALEPPPAAPVDIPFDGHPTLGPVDAPFTIVEFADFSCPLCQRASRVMHNIMRDFPTQVRWVFMDFPANRKGIATRIHEAGHCLQEQNLFWKYHDEVFSRLDRLAPDSAPEVAQDVGADMAAFDQCYASKEPGWAVKRSMQTARQLGVTRTPTIFVNGRSLASDNLETTLRSMLTAR